MISRPASVVVGARSVTQQCLKLGLLDEMHIDLLPLILGPGVRLFGDLDRGTELQVIAVSGNPHVTHLTYRVLR